LTVACGDSDALSLSEATSAAEAQTPILSFHQDWRIVQSTALVEGGQVVLRYAEARLGDCRGELNGRPAWTITAFAMSADGGVQSQSIWGFASGGAILTEGEATFELPRAGELQIWFQVTNRWGCNAFDSDFGRNFRFHVQTRPTATLRFLRDWTTATDGRLTAGSGAAIDFELERLASCRQTRYGFAAWEILAFYRFDGGAVSSVPLTAPDGYERIAVLAPIELPAGARELEMWFKNSDAAGCVAWDSRFGENYRFSIAAP
jgi:hypothetical protein